MANYFAATVDVCAVHFGRLKAPPVTEAARIDVAQEPEAVVAGVALPIWQDLRSRSEGAALFPRPAVLSDPCPRKTARRTVVLAR